MRARTVAVLLATLALALPAAAQAALPKTSNTLIVPGKSIGGVALGGSLSSVTKAWGPNKACEYQCLYEGKAGAGETPSLGSVLLETKTSGGPGKVWMIFINVAQKTIGDKLVPDFNTPLTRFRTAKGIGLGSKVTELKQAYHSAKKSSTGTSDLSFYTIKGPKEIATNFTVGAAGKITSIQVESHPGG
jgi:hypothetical protein